MCVSVLYIVTLLYMYKQRSVTLCDDNNNKWRLKKNDIAKLHGIINEVIVPNIF